MLLLLFTGGSTYPPLPSNSQKTVSVQATTIATVNAASTTTVSVTQP